MSPRYLIFAALFSVAFFCAGPAHAQDACKTAYAPIESVDARLGQAADALSKKDAAMAESIYTAAFADLGQLPWTVPNANCDPPRYTFEKLVVMDRSLLLATGIGIMNAIDAKAHEDTMMQSVMPGLAVRRYAEKYPDLAKRLDEYTGALRAAWTAQETALHSPAGPNCSAPSVDPIALQTNVTLDPNVFASALQHGTGTLHAGILVELSATGAPLRATVQTTSGDAGFDRAAVLAARATTFLPRVRNCMRVVSTILFPAEISAGK